MTKKKTRGTPRRAKKRAARSTALARRKVITPAEILPATPAPAVLDRTLDSGIQLGELGLVEIKFTPEEEAVLAEAVPADKVLIKPNGAPYLPHAEYTRWFNRAFGRGGWLLVPVGVPGMANATVICPYVLFIHGKPAALAQGEQEFFNSNKGQSYGDALESTVASALRRCAKHLGVGLELWDRAWLDAWMDATAVRVKVKQRDGTIKTQWRRKTDRPLPFEVGKARQDDYEEDGQGEPEPRRQAPPAAPPRPPAPAVHDANGEKPISRQQQQKLGVTITNSGRDVGQVQKWVERIYGAKTSAEIKQGDYKAIVNAIESTNDLPRSK
jgi:hypothetical protein